jgi:predicted nuclease with TOPRIM domain
MAIKHTAVSYYGFNYVEHAEKDFIEMKQKVYELEDENYRLKERINELYSMINSVDCSDEIEELTVKLDHLNKF